MVAHEAIIRIHLIIAIFYSTIDKRLVGPVIGACQRTLVPGQVINRRMLKDPDRNIIVLLRDIIIFLLLNDVEVDRFQIFT
ncbi:hypothetical protein D3C80_1501070 [compost metagenome]